MDVPERLEMALRGRYRIERLLGEGGMAVVYLAEDLKHRRPVALKVLRPELSAALGVERFRREIEIAARLNHPNILALHDSGEADGLLFFVMPFVEGETLRARLDREGRLGVDAAVRITNEVGRALGYAHAQGLVHRDIKPENILFQAGQALVSDFGIALAAGQAQDRLTGTGVSVGTFVYMSPEQLGDDVAVDARADVYALACVLHEMLSGASPFTASSPQAVLAKKLTGAVPDLTALRSDVPPTVQDVVECALRVEADGRFETAEAFTQALTRAITAAEVERDARLRRRSRRLRTGGMAVAIGGLGAVGWWLTTLAAGPSMQLLAVQQFRNERNDPTQDFFVEGLHQDLVVELSKAVRVISPTSMARYAGSALGVREIAGELGVDGVVQGRVRIGADAVELLLQLVDGETEEIVWSEMFTQHPRDIITLFHRATRAIAMEIGSELSPDVLARLAEEPQVDPQVYEALLQARFHWHKLTEEGIATATDYYRLALERDPRSAEAWFGLSQMWGIRAQMGLVSGADAVRFGQEPFDSAMAIDPTLASVQAQLALRRVWGEWDWVAGETSFWAALEEDPSDSVTRAYYSHLLLYLGRDAESTEQVERAVALDPFNTLVQGLYAMQLNFLRRYDAAEAVLARARERDPEAPILLSTLRTTFHLKGDVTRSMEMWRASYDALGDTAALRALDDGYAMAGYSGALRAVADAFVERASRQYVPPWQIATLLLRGGSGAAALDPLEQAFEAHDSNIPYLSVDPIFDPVRGEPRFQVLMDRLGLSR